MRRFSYKKTFISACNNCKHVPNMNKEIVCCKVEHIVHKGILQHHRAQMNYSLDDYSRGLSIANF